MLCPDCGRMTVTKRESYDPKEAIWCKNPCDCTNESAGESYYKEDGEFSVDPNPSVGHSIDVNGYCNKGCC